MLGVKISEDTTRMSAFHAAIPAVYAEDPQLLTDILDEIIDLKIEKELRISPTTRNTCSHCGSACTGLSVIRLIRALEWLPGRIFVAVHGTYTCDNPNCTEECKQINEQRVQEAMDVILESVSVSPTRTTEDMTSPDETPAATQHLEQRRTNKRRRVQTDEDQYSAQACARKFRDKFERVP
jgi:hypothetical protein